LRRSASRWRAGKSRDDSQVAWFEGTMKAFFLSMFFAVSVSGSALVILCNGVSAAEFCEIRNVVSQTDASTEVAMVEYGKLYKSLLGAMNAISQRAQKPNVAIGQQLSTADLDHFRELRTEIALIIAQKLKVSNFQRDVHVLAETYHAAELADLYDLKAETLGTDDPRKFYLTILEMMRIAQPRAPRTPLAKSNMECDLEAALFLMEEFNQQQLSKNAVMSQRLVNLISDIERLRTLYQLSKNLLEKGLAEFRGATVAVGGDTEFPNIIEPYIAASFPATQLMYKHITPYIAQQYPSDQALETTFQTEQRKQIEKDYPSSKN